MCENNRKETPLHILVEGVVENCSLPKKPKSLIPKAKIDKVDLSGFKQELSKFIIKTLTENESYSSKMKEISDIIIELPESNSDAQGCPGRTFPRKRHYRLC